MSDNFDTEEYWENRLQAKHNMRGTGHRSFDLEYNYWLYQAQRDCMDDIILRNEIQIAGKRVLDIGSGFGFYVKYFLDRNAKKVFGLDLTYTSKQNLDQQFSQGVFYKADISDEKMPFTGSFDIISSMGVMYHIVDDKRFDQALDNICALLGPQGFLFITDTLRNPFISMAQHARMRSFENYRRKFEKSNIEIIEILPLYFFSNRIFIPILGPLLLNTFRLGKWLYLIDKRLRKSSHSNGNGLKILVARRNI